MARKTKAELVAEQEAERVRRALAERDAYPVRLLEALEEATTKNNYELTVVNSMFALRDRDSRDALTLSLTMAYTANSQDALENLEWDLQSKAEERAERERRSQAKQAALAKLTPEEKELLNL